MEDGTLLSLLCASWVAGGTHPLSGLHCRWVFSSPACYVLTIFLLRCFLTRLYSLLTYSGMDMPCLSFCCHVPHFVTVDLCHSFSGQTLSVLSVLDLFFPFLGFELSRQVQRDGPKTEMLTHTSLVQHGSIFYTLVTNPSAVCLSGWDVAEVLLLFSVICSLDSLLPCCFEGIFTDV